MSRRGADGGQASGRAAAAPPCAQSRATDVPCRRCAARRRAAAWGEAVRRQRTSQPASSSLQRADPRAAEAYRVFGHGFGRAIAGCFDPRGRVAQQRAARDDARPAGTVEGSSAARPPSRAVGVRVFGAGCTRRRGAWIGARGRFGHRCVSQLWRETRATRAELRHARRARSAALPHAARARAPRRRRLMPRFLC